MPLAPDHNQISAAKLGNEFKAFILQIKNLNAATSQSALKKLQDTFLALKVRANSMLGTITQELNANQQTEVIDYYYREFLTQVSRYNQYFNEITDLTDTRIGGLANQPSTLAKYPGKPILAEAAITSIKHTLLVQSLPITMRVTLATENSLFREHSEYLEDGSVRHYYNPKDTALDEHTTHQDRTHYLEANVRIGAATQISNGRGIFKLAYGQGTDEYFKSADRVNHAQEKKCFEEAMLHIQNGKTLSDEHLAVLQQGHYYRYPKVIKFNTTPPEEKQHPDVPSHHLTHVGHAAETVAINGSVPLTLVIDPVHKQSGTDGLISVPAKLFYDRQTAPGVATDAYPKINVVIISHNHHDHMCPSSLQEGFASANTLFIVPKGDAAHMHRFGLKNVVEFNSWNDYAIIELTNSHGKKSSYEIRSFPAKHASNRGPRDLYESLYMGYMIRDVSKDHVIIFTGDTGVLDDKHFNQLEAYLLKNKLSIHTACIAHGPDRPRKWMECTHQSTADAIVMHARFNMINAAVYASKHNEELKNLTFAEIENLACHAIGYHQGCFRLGLLTNQDVNTTITRMLLALDSTSHVPLAQVTGDVLNKNVFYQMMDEFERIATLQVIAVYKRVKHLSLHQIVKIISAHLTIPVPGANIDFQLEQPHPGFKLNYLTLLQNRDPNQKTYHKNGAAYEYFAYHLPPELALAKMGNVLVETGMQFYLKRSRNPLKASKAAGIQEFLTRLPHIAEGDLLFELGKLYSATFPVQDNGIRDEGHFHTLVTILVGLIYSAEFRQQFAARYYDLQPQQLSLRQQLSLFSTPRAPPASTNSPALIRSPQP